jgi:2-isopropylmalate synthase
MSKSAERVYIFDTTLRDGEQSPGVNLGVKEKIEIARQLEHLGVDIIEAGFPITSPGDAAAVSEVAKVIKSSTICALARAVEKDMDVALAALKPARNKRLHVFLATSAIHRKYKLRKAKSEIERMAVWAVEYARKRIDEVEFSPEDASRTERDFLFRVVEKVIKAGARVINIPDTVGYTTPYEFRDLIEDMRNSVPNINKAIISVHCHDDLGMSVSNSLSAVLGGARQIECTINGIGERAGNASLEEIVMAIRTRSDIFPFKTNVRAQGLCEISRMVSKLTGMLVQPNKAIVGKNAFAHESGIHQHGVIAKRSTYEIMSPASVGFGESNLVLGKHSGRHAFVLKLKKLGYRLNDAQIDGAFIRFKELADRKQDLFEEDLRSIVDVVESDKAQVIRLESLKIETQTGRAPKAEIKIYRDGKLITASGTGDGPVDAAYRTLNQMLGVDFKLLDYAIRSASSGQDAQGQVSVLVASSDGREARGRSSTTDVIEASVRAYIDAVSRLISSKKAAAAGKGKGIGQASPI